jgi:hypothetical protein
MANDRMVRAFRSGLGIDFDFEGGVFLRVHGSFGERLVD